MISTAMKWPTLIKKLFAKPAPLKPKKGRVRREVLTTQGEHHDLAEIYSSVNTKYFDGKIDLPIGWSGNKESRPKTRIVLGTYHLIKKTIRVHRLLDQPHVPRSFVSYIVYHEMLHHVLPPVQVKRRRRKIHHSEFVQREKMFEEYEEASAFMKGLRTNLNKLYQ